MLRHVAQALALYLITSVSKESNGYVRPCSVPALSLSVPTAVFLKLSPDPLPVLSNPFPPDPPLPRPSPWPVYCRWAFLNHWAQCLSGMALTLTFLQHLCYQVLWTLKAINQELWMCVKSGAEPGGIGCGSMISISSALLILLLLLSASMAPSGGHTVLCPPALFYKLTQKAALSHSLD